MLEPGSPRTQGLGAALVPTAPSAPQHQPIAWHLQEPPTTFIRATLKPQANAGITTSRLLQDALAPVDQLPMPITDLHDVWCPRSTNVWGTHSMPCNLHECWQHSKRSQLCIPTIGQRRHADIHHDASPASLVHPVPAARPSCICFTAA